MFGLSDLVSWAGKELLHGAESIFGGGSPSTSPLQNMRAPGSSLVVPPGSTDTIGVNQLMPSTGNMIHQAQRSSTPTAIANARPVGGYGAPSCDQAIMTPTATTRLQCQPGYVVVEWPRGSGQKVCMDKALARERKLWRAPHRPPIKASDWRALKKANTVVNRIDRVVDMSNNVVGKNKMRRVSPHRKK